MRVAAILLFLATSAVAAPRYWGDLQPGPHAVGFRLLKGESAAGAAGMKPRPIEIALWYPAVRSDAKPMTFGDYFQASPDIRATLSESITGDANGITAEKAKSIEAAPMFAQRDASSAPGRTPVVLWSARYGTTAAQSVLSEYLASHGFVVAFARPVDASVRLPFELKTVEEKLAELNLQVDDMRGALRAVRALANVNSGSTVLLAWSYAGESATRLHWTDARVRGVIGLDTNLLNGWIYQPQSALATRFPFVELKKSDLGLAHGNFNALEGMIPAIEGIENVQRWSKSGPDAKKGYETIARRVKDAVAARLASPTVDSFVQVEFKSSDDVTVTADFYRAAAQRGCILMIHQSGASRGEFRTIAPELVRDGYTVLAMDGRWGRRDYWNDVWNETARRFGTIEVMDRQDREAARKIESTNDIIAGAEWLSRNGCQSIAFWGSSIHANAILGIAANKTAKIDALVAFSPGDYRGRYQEGEVSAIAEKLTVPTFIAIAAEEDEIAAPIYRSVPADRLTLYRSTARHGSAILFEDPPAWAAVKSFLAGVMLSREDQRVSC